MADELTDKADADLARVLDLYAAAIRRDYSRNQFRTWDRLNAVMCEAARRLRTPPTPDLSAEASAKEIAREIGQAIWKSQRLSGEPHGIWLDEAVAAVLPVIARVRQETEERIVTLLKTLLSDTDESKLGDEAAEAFNDLHNATAAERMRAWLKPVVAAIRAGRLP